MTEQDAVSLFLKDGDAFTVGGFLMNRESDNVFREIARQGQKHLTYIEESCTLGIDLLFGMGAIDRFDQAYMPNRQLGDLTGLPQLNRCLNEGEPRPVEMGGCVKTANYKGNKKWIKVVDWTNFMIALRFVAGSMNVPFMPCRSAISSDIVKNNDEIKIIDDPYGNKPTVLVPAINPDVAFISVQKADQRGNGQIFGYKGVEGWKGRAPKHVVLITGALVSAEETMKHRTNTVVPA